MSKYKKRKTNRRSQSMRKIALTFLCVTTAVAGVLQIATWLNAQEMFLFRKIVVKGNRYISEEEILDRIEIDSTKNLFDVDLQLLAQTVELHPHIESVTVTRGFPSRLIINVTVREPLALLNDRELTPLDSSGKPIPGFEPNFIFNYPIITMATDSQIDSEDLSKILEFLKTTKKDNLLLYHEISEISYSAKFGIYFYTNTRAIPVIVGEDGIVQKNNRFIKVFKRLQQDLSNIEYFDLRFNNRVIVKQNDLG